MQKDDFSVLDQKYPFLAKFAPKKNSHLKLKFGATIMQKSK